MGARILFVAAGIIALGVGTIITLGAALAGVLSIGIAAWVLHRRSRRITRRGSWFASVVGTAGVLSVLIGMAFIATSNDQPMPTAAQRAERRAQATQAMPEWLRAINPNAQRQSAAADSMAAQLLESKAVVIWAGLMVAVLGSAVVGTIAGTFAWGGVMLLYRGLQGDWMPGSVPDPLTGL